MLYTYQLSVALDWEWRGIWIEGTYRKKGRRQRETKTDREKERNSDKERKKERIVTKVSDRDGNYIHVHYTKDYIYKYMLYTYQQVLHLIENDEAYK